MPVGYERRLYRPERLPQAAERTIGEGSLRTARDVVRQIHQTGEATFFGKPQTKDEHWEISQHLKSLEARALSDWATEHGYWLDADEFTRKWLLRGEIEGGEHQVYLEDDKVFKRNNLLYHTTRLEYFHRLILHNWLFPETAVHFLGLMLIEDNLQPVISQQAFEAIRGASRREVENEMNQRGFQRQRADNYYSSSRGIMVEDLHDENVLVSPKGSILIFDPVIYLSRPETE